MNDGEGARRAAHSNKANAWRGLQAPRGLGASTYDEDAALRALSGVASEAPSDERLGRELLAHGAGMPRGLAVVADGVAALGALAAAARAQPTHPVPHGDPQAERAARGGDGCDALREAERFREGGR